MRTFTPDQLLRMTIQGELDRVSSEAMVRYCIERTVCIIRWSNGRFAYTQSRLGLSIDDLAYDIVADLVSGDEDAYCSRLRHALLNLPHDSEEERITSFEGTLLRNVSQSLSHLLSEFNRVQFLLRRSLRSGVRRRGDIVTLDMLDGRWYMLHDSAHACLERASMTWEQMRLHTRTSRTPGKSLALGLLEDVLELLENQSMYRKAVREGDIIRIATEIFASQMQTVEELEAHASQTEDFSGMLQEIEAHLPSALNDVMDELGEFYDSNNRLNSDEMEAFALAASDYVHGAARGEAETQYSYLREYMPGLTNERYRESYRNRLAYFIRKVTERLAFYIKTE
jgi:hypothetical protein